ncbi:MAG: Leu/Ile/Val/Thr/Ala-binding protein [Gemmatimonadetes bacterium]|nr:Leu/Ile/Val/Thr/Ala-binding protein [Gemmatimonadota bacterium]
MPRLVPSPRFVSPAALALAGLLCACGSGAGGGPVYFGLAAPLHNSTGQAYAIGESTRQGADLAVRQVNDGGGIRGRRLELVVRDDSARPDRAIAVAGEMVRDARVLAVAGHANSGKVIKAAPTYEGHVAALATSATSPEITSSGDWTFRVASSDAGNAVVMARRALAVSPRIAVLYSNDDFGHGLSAPFEAEVLRGGGTIVEEDPYLPEMDDFTPYLLRIRGRGVRMVFIAGVDVGAAKIIAQARRVGLDATFMGSSALERLKTMGPAYEGTLVGLLYHPDASPSARRFADAFRQAYGHEPDSFAVCAYDAVMLLARAAREAGPDRGAIRGYLAGVGAASDGAAPFAGAAGTLRFDRNGDPVDKSFVIGAIRGGAMVLEGRR